MRQTLCSLAGELQVLGLVDVGLVVGLVASLRLHADHGRHHELDLEPLDVAAPVETLQLALPGPLLADLRVHAHAAVEAAGVEAVLVGSPHLEVCDAAPAVSVAIVGPVVTANTKI